MITFPIYTTEQSRELDEKTISAFQFSDDVLMELAGSKTADQLMLHSARSVLFLIGPGNNGGDGLVAARHLALANQEIDITIFELYPEKRNKLNQLNFERIKKIKRNNVIRFISGKVSELKKYNLIVDALFGTGLSRTLNEKTVSVIEWANQQETTKICLDCPSGLDTNTGKTNPIAFKADITLTFGQKKLGFYFNESFEYCGEILKIPIGFDGSLIKDFVFEIHPEPKDTVLSHRKHKYEDGFVTIIAGSEGLSGAAFLAAKAAIYAGAPAVNLIYPKGLFPVFDMLLPEVIKIGIGEENDRYFKSDHIGSIKEMLSKGKHSVVLGPGIGRNPETESFVHQLIASCNHPLLIDADALYHCKTYQKRYPKHCILTPHLGELAHLCDKIHLDDDERLQTTQKLAKSTQSFIFSKGTFGFLCSPHGETFFLPYPNTHFRKAGFGDVFSGYLGAIRLNQSSMETAFVVSSFNLYTSAKNYTADELTALKLISH